MPCGLPRGRLPRGTVARSDPSCGRPVNRSRGRAWSRLACSRAGSSRVEQPCNRSRGRVRSRLPCSCAGSSRVERVARRCRQPTLAIQCADTPGSAARGPAWSYASPAPVGGACRARRRELGAARSEPAASLVAIASPGRLGAVLGPLGPLGPLGRAQLPHAPLRGVAGCSSAGRTPEQGPASNDAPRADLPGSCRSVR
jgi:hypothetical protein